MSVSTSRAAGFARERVQSVIASGVSGREDRARALQGRSPTVSPNLGCRFALDDFGAGFGSFYYLEHLPFDYVKIDGEFITRCTTNRTDQLVIESLVTLAHGMNKRTIAECVEDRDTQLFLRRKGVDLAQGHYIGRPSPVAHALSHRQRRRRQLSMSDGRRGRRARAPRAGLGQCGRAEPRRRTAALRRSSRRDASPR
jgi:predicted signal transduction protein with EAL and GGDEF domain